MIGSFHKIILDTGCRMLVKLRMFFLFYIQHLVRPKGAKFFKNLLTRTTI